MLSRLDRIKNWKTPARKGKYSVLRLAKLLQTSPRHLERYFHEKFGCSPKAWLKHLRARDAKRLLGHGLMVKQVAERLGFKNATHFSRAFRRLEGLNPLAIMVASRRDESDVAKRSKMSRKGL